MADSDGPALAKAIYKALYKICQDHVFTKGKSLVKAVSHYLKLSEKMSPDNTKELENSIMKIQSYLDIREHFEPSWENNSYSLAKVVDEFAQELRRKNIPAER